MDKELKRRIAFALVMGSVTTGIVSFALIALNFGFTERFLAIWMRSWGAGFAFAIPAILLIGPRIQMLVNRLIPQS